MEQRVEGMPGFAENLRRLEKAAGVSLEAAADHLGAAPSDLSQWSAPGAPLPELHVLVRLADALGCKVDDLLEGADEDFDHPQRRHAALIAARMGRVRSLLTQVRLARARGALTPASDREINEAALLATVERCRAWVMSEDHALDRAAAIEAELDQHVERVRAIFDAATAVERTPFVPSPLTSPPPLRVVASRPLVAPAVQAVPAAPAPVSAEAAPAGPPRAKGHRSTLWSQADAKGDQQCILVTRPREVDVELLVDDQLIASRTCRTLDEAFQQSSEWRRTYLASAILTAEVTT